MFLSLVIFRHFIEWYLVNMLFFSLFWPDPTFSTMTLIFHAGDYWASLEIYVCASPQPPVTWGTHCFPRSCPPHSPTTPGANMDPSDLGDTSSDCEGTNCSLASKFSENCSNQDCYWEEPMFGLVELGEYNRSLQHFHITVFVCLAQLYSFYLGMQECAVFRDADVFHPCLKALHKFSESFCRSLWPFLLKSFTEVTLELTCSLWSSLSQRCSMWSRSCSFTEN